MALGGYNKYVGFISTGGITWAVPDSMRRGIDLWGDFNAVLDDFRDVENGQ